VASEGARRPTLAEVAERAGVSKATASKVLNSRPDVSMDTRQRVEAILQELAYVPTNGPRGSMTSAIVNVVFDDLVNLYSTQVLIGVLRAASELNIELVVETIADAPDPARRPLSKKWVASAVRKGRLGTVIVTTEVNAAIVRALREGGLPMVVIDPKNLYDDSVVSITSTNFQGAVQATTHLLKLGHTRIAFAGGPLNSATARERFHGYRSALENAGVPDDAELASYGDFTFESGVELASRFLSIAKRPTAIFAASDSSALGALEAARRYGLRVPDDVSIVGFDDTPAAVWTAPPLTTVHQPMIELGRVALVTVQELARGGRPVSRHIQLATSLITRASSAPPPTTSV
jgi:LacI family transcriptional regulator